MGDQGKAGCPNQSHGEVPEERARHRNNHAPVRFIMTITGNKEWILTKEPLHFYEPVLTGLDCGLSFGRELLKHVPDSVSIALIPCAVGGSSVQHWLGDSLHRGVLLLSNFKENVDFANRHGTVKGVLWHQGESDAKTELILVYRKNLEKLISTFRQVVQKDDLPVLLGELGSFAEPGKQAREVKQRCGKKSAVRQ